MKECSRRQALTFTGIAAAGVAGAGMVAGCSNGGAGTSANKNGGDTSKDAENSPASIAPENRWAQTDLVMIGDSITFYDCVENTNGETAKGYASYLRPLFRKIDNYAVAGASVAYHPESKYEDVLETIQKINFADYGMCSIAAGINDCEYTFSQLGELVPVDVAKSKGSKDFFDIKTFCGGYQYILDKIYRDNPTIQLVIFTPLKSKVTSTAGFVNQVGHTVDEYVELIRKIARMYSIPMLDLNYSGGLNHYNFDEFTIDGLHPNNKGYKFICPQVVSFFENLG